MSDLVKETLVPKTPKVINRLSLMAKGKAFGKNITLTLRYGIVMWHVEVQVLTSHEKDSRLFNTLFFARRYFNKLVEKYGLTRGASK